MVTLIPPVLGADAKVEDLIDQTSMQCRRELIAENFLAPDAKLFLSTPLSTRSVDDKLIWHHAKDGIYSVRLGYWVAKDLIDEDAKRVKGEGERLVSKHVPILSVCKRCGEKEELVEQTFMGCDKVVEIWHLVSANSQPQDWEIQGLGSRNVAHSKLANLARIIERASDLRTEYQEAINVQTTSISDPRVHWSPPLLGIFKVNVDGTCNSERNVAGVEVIIRDCHGTSVAACSQKLLSCLSAEVVELVASCTARTNACSRNCVVRYYC
ncbi:hypothetical protein Acr_20g0009740 [Actinidia rufa]|uniref:RNase H type-1 domain-containing protein n=1 Tax=Actinidia rufa TaxID=165716 RepID=A0A7J0GED0_9ERIC|nr:hypothetical protein Acr_20g0009740 [Actinidia rufa]